MYSELAAQIMTPLQSQKKLDVNGKVVEHFEQVTGRTRAGKNGKDLKCPCCETKMRIYHLSWTSLQCRYCHTDVPKNEWLVDQLDTWRTPR